MIYAVRFERLFLELLSSNNHQLPDVKKIKIYKRFERFWIVIDSGIYIIKLNPRLADDFENE